MKNSIPRTTRAVMAKISIIIPVYNTEAYLDDCLKSVCEQTFQDIEVICVDDGSKDKSLQILQTYAQKDNRITVITQANAGQSVARNVAMKKATGEYVIFLDSDDYLTLDACQQLYDRAVNDNLDCVHFELNPFADSRKFNQVVQRRYANMLPISDEYLNVYSGIDLLYKRIRTKQYEQSVCLCMTRRTVFTENAISFLEGIIHEDIAFPFVRDFCVRRASYINKKIYQRRWREGSTMSAINRPRSVVGAAVAALNVLQFLRTRDVSLTREQTTAFHDYVYNNLLYSLQNYALLSRTERDTLDWKCFNVEKRYFFLLKKFRNSSEWNFKMRRLIKKIPGLYALYGNMKKCACRLIKKIPGLYALYGNMKKCARRSR